MNDKLVITIECEKECGGEETADILSKRLRMKSYDVKALEAVGEGDSTEKIKKIASKESCIFLSCNANAILKSHLNIIRVFISSAKKADKENTAWNNATNYDLAINTAVIGTEGAVQVILEYLTAKS